MDKELLITLTADIVAAHVANNSVAVGDVGNLVQQVHNALAGIGEEAEVEPEAKNPAVSIKASIKPEYLVCMECGKKQKTLKRHLQSAHNMTPEQYRSDYGLPATYPMSAPEYSKTRQEMAKKIGLGYKGRRKKAAGQNAPTGKKRSNKTEG